MCRPVPMEVGCGWTLRLRPGRGEEGEGDEGEDRKRPTSQLKKAAGEEDNEKVSECFWLGSTL